jgi:hypothetical protein
MSGRISEHGELVFDMLRYATRLLAEGDESTLMVLGFTAAQIRAIETLTLRSLQRVSALSSHFLDFRIDPLCFERVMRRIEQEGEDEALKDELLRAGAPIRMMHHFWGMTSRDCAERRRVLDVEAPIGRPALADDGALERLWLLWQETSAIVDERRRYLGFTKRSELLSVIWIAVEVEGREQCVDALHSTTRSPASAPVSDSTARRVVELTR